VNRIKLLLAALAGSLLIGCGGGGGGGGQAASLEGRVLSIVTGDATNPATTVQAIGGSPSTTTDLTDGSFTLTGVPKGTTQCQAIPGNSWPLFTFQFPAANGTTDVGDLWVGPEQVTVHGVIHSSVDDTPVPNATVRFAGRQATSNSSGEFDISGVAYSSATQVAFWGIIGTINATGFFEAEFSTSPVTADGSNVVDVGTLLVTPSGSSNPPGLPYNITGRVLPIGSSSGCIVTLKESGSAVRVFNVGSDGKYYFWIEPGTYTIDYQKGGQSAPTQNATVTQPNSTVTVPDVTLN